MMSKNNNHSQRSHRNMSKHSKAKSQVETTSSCSSDYSTCSDNPQTDMYWHKYKSRESVILAGQLVLNRLEETNLDSVLEDSNFPINPLEVNLDSVLDIDVLSSENDVYSDCRNSTTESHNDSTMYLELGPVFNSKVNLSNPSNINSCSSQMTYQQVSANEPKDSSPVARMLQERLLTIIEEREITNTTDYIVKDLLPSNQNTSQLVTEIIDQVEMHQEENNNLKQVSFFDLDKVEDNQINKLIEKNAPNLSDIKSKWPRKVNDPCNHNTTESFVLWEKFCEASEKLASRRSFSFSELNTVSETCSSDRDCSANYKTQDDMYLSRNSAEIENNNKSYPCKNIGRSISCESILREVKHLPHLLYDRFLKCLSREIERIRKENVVCTCPKLYSKNSNKENERKKGSKNKENERKKDSKKSTSKLTNKISTIRNGELESRSPLQNKIYSGAINRELSPKAMNRELSPKAINRKLSPKARNHTHLSSPTAAYGMRLSPEAATHTRLSSQDVDRTKLSPEAPSKTLSQLQLSPKSPAKTPTTPSKSRYFWNKQIVSPIGEYIRGKRPSPYQNPPNKK